MSAQQDANENLLLEEDRWFGGVNLFVTGPWSVAAERCLREGRADGLVLNYARGYSEPNLEFLGECVPCQGSWRVCPEIGVTRGGAWRVESAARATRAV